MGEEILYGFRCGSSFFFSFFPWEKASSCDCKVFSVIINVWTVLVCSIPPCFGFFRLGGSVFEREEEEKRSLGSREVFG